MSTSQNIQIRLNPSIVSIDIRFDNKLAPQFLNFFTAASIKHDSNSCTATFSSLKEATKALHAYKLFVNERGYIKTSKCFTDAVFADLYTHSPLKMHQIETLKALSFYLD